MEEKKDEISVVSGSIFTDIPDEESICFII